MKKLSLIVVSLLVTLFSYSQDFSKIVAANKSEWRNEKWVTVETYYPKDMFVIIKDWSITIGTYKFKTYDDPEKTTYDTHVTYSWKCVNGNGDKCLFMMKKFKPEISSHILYSILYPETGVMYEYEGEN
jgi:hypothetical protein